MTDEAQFVQAFGPAAEEYERGRPRYPAAALDRLESELGLDRESVVLDLAAGTGKLTRDLVPRFARVIAVEPLQKMLAQLRRQAAEADPLIGTAEAIPVEDGSVDAVFVAQAFHWFDGHRALEEIARILRPGGGLALLWNTTPWENREDAWFAELDDLLDGSRADLSVTRRHHSGRWREPFEQQEHFEPLSTATFSNTQYVSREEFIAGLASRSYIARLDPSSRGELLGQIAASLDEPGAPIEHGQVVVPMRTMAYWARLRGRSEPA
jgi:ubiquinone/menaquinone biosynthesis C-methylase UbiE